MQEDIFSRWGLKDDSGNLAQPQSDHRPSFSRWLELHLPDPHPGADAPRDRRAGVSLASERVKC